jgi:hypothetical protein
MRERDRKRKSERVGEREGEKEREMPWLQPTRKGDAQIGGSRAVSAVLVSVKLRTSVSAKFPFLGKRLDGLRFHESFRT